MTNVPEIRFKGFTNAWEQRKFEDDISLVGGATPFKQNAEYWGGDIVWLSSQEIKEKYVASGTYKITKKALDDNATKAVKSGTPLIVSRSGVLANRFPISIPTVDVAINQDIKALVYDTDKINTDFIFAHLQKLEDYILKSVVKGGTTVQSVNVPDLQKMELGYPAIAEQSRIGQFFRTLDNTIAIHKRKLDGLRQLKKAYLQQMFPQAGETVPRVRFEGFSEPWIAVKLGDVVEKLKSYSLSRDVETENATGYRYIHYGDIHKQVADIITSDEQLPRIKSGDYIPLKQYDLVLADASEDYIGIAEPCVILHEPKEKIIAGLHTIAIRPIGTESLFLYHLFHSDGFRKFGGFMGTGLKVFGITFTNLSKYEMGLPSIEEQTAIGKFFHKLDIQIVTHEQKIEQAKQLKMVYLQKMFA